MAAPPKRTEDKKRRGKNIAKMVYLRTELDRRLNAYCEAQEVPPQANSVIRFALEKFLSERGF